MEKRGAILGLKRTSVSDAPPQAKRASSRRLLTACPVPWLWPLDAKHSRPDIPLYEHSKSHIGEPALLNQLCDDGGSVSTARAGTAQTKCSLSAVVGLQARRLSAPHAQGLFMERPARSAPYL
ncbi:hypothetical protein MHYP_G00157030 [Metynnis hypsauchen]